MSSESDLVDITVDLKHQTALAWLVSPDGKREVWVPKSQCELVKDGKAWCLTMPGWKAKEKGLV